MQNDNFNQSDEPAPFDIDNYFLPDPPPQKTRQDTLANYDDYDHLPSQNELNTNYNNEPNIRYNKKPKAGYTSIYSNKPETGYVSTYDNKPQINYKSAPSIESNKRPIQPLRPLKEYFEDDTVLQITHRGVARTSFSDGTIFEADYGETAVDAHTLIHGRGKVVLPHNSTILEGEFVDGKLLGRGRITLDYSRLIYKGGIKDNLPHGEGAIVTSSGDVYEGGFFEGVPHDRGTLIKADGEVYDGNWYCDEETGEITVVLFNRNIYSVAYIDGHFSIRKIGMFHGEVPQGEDIDNHKKPLITGKKTASLDDLKTYYLGLNLFQKKQFLSNFRLKLKRAGASSKEKAFLNECTKIFNDEATKYSDKINSQAP